MATDIAAPAPPASKYVDPDRPTGKVLPAVLLTILVAALAIGVWWLVSYIQGVQAGEALETNFVFRRLDTTVQVNAQPNPLAFFVRTFPVALVIGGLLLLGIVCRNGTPALKLWGPVVGGALAAFAILLFILRRTLPGKEIEGSLFWLSILVPILALGLFYSVWMYLRDGQAVGWAWASFLGTLRCVVYLLLAGVFLLPALQTWEKSEAVSKFLVLVDLSGSMNISDELATDDRAMPTRLDEVAQFLLRAEADAKADPKGARTEPPLNFMQKLQRKVPVVYYGFGGKLDDEFKEFKGDKSWTEADLKAWLRMDVKHWLLDGLSEGGKEAVTRTSGFEADKPATQEWAAEWAKAAAPEFKDPADKAAFDAKKDKLPKRLDLRQQMLTGSNYGDSLLAMITRESNSMLAGVLIIGDGNSNQGSPSTYDEIRRRAANLKVPVFAIGVGQERKQIHIRITDLQAPEQAPPDDKFLVRVEVDGEGLADQDFDVFLDVYSPQDPKKPALQLKATSKFKLAPGSVIPHGQVEFGIDPADEQLAALMIEDKQTGKRELREGEWRFVARIAKAKGESFVGKEHVSDPAAVQVVKRPLRILLFAGGPTREYQFVRRLLVNEVDKKRAELSIFLQVTDQKGARVQDVPQERLLKQFPDTLRPPNEGTPDEKYYNLGQYDVIVAFDPDWSQVSEASLKLVQEWVKDQAGGLILLGGPINTWQLARRGGNFDKLRPIVDLYPVRVEDSRLAGQNLDRPTTEPWRLNFRNLSDETAFLKLDEEGKGPLAGWEEFFAGIEKPTRGFYAYYPVKSVKPGATILATYTDPRGRITRDDDPNKTDEQPYIVTMPFGGGKVVYLSSGEFWRLRLYKEMFHERFWTKLGRYVASGTQLRQTSRGVLVMARQFTAGQQVRLEARLRGIDLKPLAMGSEVKIKVTPPEGVVMKPDEFKLEPKKEGEWDGWFRGRFEAKAPGEYRIDLSIPGTNDTLTKKFLVKESNPELDNVKPNFALLYELASPITALRGDTGDLKQQLRASLRPELLEKAPRDDTGKESDLRLFFDLKTGPLVPDQVKPERRTNRSRGPVDDLWDEGPTIGQDQSGKPRVVSLVLLLAVGLLSAEWLTRKLLKLA